MTNNTFNFGTLRYRLTWFSHWGQQANVSGFPAKQADIWITNNRYLGQWWIPLELRSPQLEISTGIPPEVGFQTWKVWNSETQNLRWHLSTSTESCRDTLFCLITHTVLRTCCYSVCMHRIPCNALLLTGTVTNKAFPRGIHLGFSTCTGTWSTQADIIPSTNLWVQKSAPTVSKARSQEGAVPFIAP